MRFDEAQALVERWYELARRYLSSNPMCPMMEAGLVLYHLISMNAVTHFSEIERFAREGRVTEPAPHPTLVESTCVPHVRDAIVHAGQVLLLIKGMSPSVRPPWWPAAVYRAALTLWLEGWVQKSMTANQRSGFGSEMTLFPIDSLPASHPTIIDYLSGAAAMPCLTAKDGTLIEIDHDVKVLHACLDIIGDGVATRFSDGIRSKLGRLVVL
jgi:hypothetical protein